MSPSPASQAPAASSATSRPPSRVVPVEEIRRDYPDYAGNMAGSMLPPASNGLHYAVPVLGYWEYLYVNKAFPVPILASEAGDHPQRNRRRVLGRGFPPSAGSKGHQGQQAENPNSFHFPPSSPGISNRVRIRPGRSSAMSKR